MVIHSCSGQGSSTSRKARALSSRPFQPPSTELGSFCSLASLWPGSDTGIHSCLIARRARACQDTRLAILGESACVFLHARQNQRRTELEVHRSLVERERYRETESRLCPHVCLPTCQLKHTYTFIAPYKIHVH